MNLGLLEDKVVIVTGSAFGIGRGTAQVIASEGASVVVADIDAASAEAAVESLRNAGLSAASIGVDISNEQQVKDMVDFTMSTYGRIDAIHNNAALITPEQQIKDVSIDNIDFEFGLNNFRVNVMGCALCTKYVLPHMLDRAGGGVIVNTASVAASSSELVRPIYGASKAAVVALTRSIATQYGKRGVRAISVSPGFIQTEGSKRTLQPDQVSRFVNHTLVSRPGEPEDIGHLVAFLMSERASYITGIDIKVDGGLTAHFPQYAEERTDLL